MNPQAFFLELEKFLTRRTADVVDFTPMLLRIIEGDLNRHMNQLEVMVVLGFNPSFHFKVTLAVDPVRRCVRANIVPLTVIGLEMLMSSGVQIDESLQKRIRQFQDQQVVGEIVSHRRSEEKSAQEDVACTPSSAPTTES